MGKKCIGVLGVIVSVVGLNNDLMGMRPHPQNPLGRSQILATLRLLLRVGGIS
ncbi:MAG: hypothetical protein LBS14_03045 [Holosporaceae bacterium]|nr:hypothetical protein [Holosporaceae bacterium]